VINESLKTNQTNEEYYTTIPAVMKVVQEGFPLELAIQAYCLVGDDPALMIQVISENMLS